MQYRRSRSSHSIWWQHFRVKWSKLRGRRLRIRDCSTQWLLWGTLKSDFACYANSNYIGQRLENYLCCIVCICWMKWSDLKFYHLCSLPLKVSPFLSIISVSSPALFDSSFLYGFLVVLSFNDSRRSLLIAVAMILFTLLKRQERGFSSASHIYFIRVWRGEMEAARNNRGRKKCRSLSGAGIALIRGPPQESTLHLRSFSNARITVLLSVCCPALLLSLFSFSILLRSLSPPMLSCLGKLAMKILLNMILFGLLSAWAIYFLSCAALNRT